MENTVIFSNVLAILALIVSIASAAYAYISAKAAQTANRIGLHQPRKDIYDGLLEFRMLFVGMDLHPTREEIDGFYIKSVAPAQIYLLPELAQKIHEIYKKSWELYNLIDIAESGDCFETSKWEYIDSFQDLGRNELEAVIQMVTTHIHVGRT